MSALAGHKFIIIGDSYTVGITAGGQTITSWLGWFTQWYGSEWTGYVANPRGGYGFSHTNMYFVDLLNELDNQISDKSSITDILVAGGYNDGGYLTTLPDRIAEFATVARQKYTNATLWIAPIGWTTNQYQNIVSQAIEMYITYGNINGYRVMSEMKYIMRNTEDYLSADQIHPNEDGYKALATAMHTYLLSYLATPKIRYNGSDKWKQKATELLNQGGGGGTQEVYYGTTAEWSAQPTLVSARGAIYVYSDYDTDSENRDIPNLKVGDGQTCVVDLAFMNCDITEAQKQFWNNKVTALLSEVDNETLIFTKN